MTNTRALLGVECIPGDLRYGRPGREFQTALVAISSC
jgi:hypothetical protein